MPTPPPRMGSVTEMKPLFVTVPPSNRRIPLPKVLSMLPALVTSPGANRKMPVAAEMKPVLPL
jgi:hypothetical protein